ncbi:MAG: glycoside hydrolase N-terminal domain-containing protein, partial [Phycisphaeraceae bacterium]|nr:glycoside hydrolase N-terminal domain-containing protein [Phycisphaeraceae bacterium]
MSDTSNVLWFDRPAAPWEAALPVGNGSLGAMVFGRTETERIQLTEESIWAGPPFPEMPESAAEGVREARKLLFEGKYVEADRV